MAPGGAPNDANLTEMARGQEPDKSTTTLSTIAVKAGVNASIVVALLKSAGYIQLRVDEMQPKLLSIGNSSQEAKDLLNIHDDLIRRLQEKDDQVVALLSRADSLGAEKTNPNEAIVYDEMAKSLRETWRSLNRQLLLRGYMLRETVQFYTLAESHEKLSTKTIEIVQQINEQNSQQLQSSIDKLINDIIDTTASVVDLGSSVISQIRTLGQLDDNPERPQEILDASVKIESIMLRVASDWERSEQLWQERKSGVSRTTTTTEDELVVIEQWLSYAEKKVKALNEAGQKNVLSEGNKHVHRLRELANTPSSDGGRISHLSGRIEEFLHYLKTRMNRSQRIHGFLQAAKSMLSQLNMMAEDMKSANAAMAGELAPLAKQKASPLIHEGKDIASKEVLSYEEQRLVRQYVEDLSEKLKEIESLAKQRKESGKTTSHFSNIKAWLDGQAAAFLAQKGDLGGNLNDARDFVVAHKQFATELINRDADVMTLLSRKPQMSPDEEQQLTEFVKEYEKVKEILENRIQIGTTYEQVHVFGKDLEGSFDALQTLLENNQEYTNDKVAAQISNVFQMILETLSQEKHQGEKFISNATQIGKSDEWLNIQRAQEAVRNMITDHENRFKYVQHKWTEWQMDKNSTTKVESVMEEIQMWQTDVLEFIGRVDNSSVTKKEEVEEIQKRISSFKNAADMHKTTLETLKEENKNEEQISRINVLIDKNDYIKTRLDQLSHKVELTSLLKIVEDVQIWQEEMVEIIRNMNQVVTTQSNNQEQFEHLRRKIEDLKVEVEKKSEHLEACKTLSQNETFQTQLHKTIQNQEQIRLTTIELQEKLEISKLIRVVQEIQMWQEEAIEIIRMLDRTQPANIQEANELIDRVHDLQQTIEHKSSRIQEVKKMSQVPEFVHKMEEVEHVQEQLKHLTVELEEKLEQQKLVKVTEHIQMWQEEMVEIIKMFDSTPMKTVQESQELQEKVKLVKEAIAVQQPKIEEVVSKAKEISVKTQIAKAVEQQKVIREMAENLERKAISATFELSQPQQTIEETKTIELTSLEQTQITLTPEEKQELQILKKIIGEIQMWQEETIEIIRLVDKTPKTIQESETLVKKINEIHQTVEAQTRRIEDASRFTKDETFTKTVQETMTKQQQVQQLVKELHERAASQNIVIRKQEEERQRVQAPQILTQLKDDEVDEGCRYEFSARINGEPEPKISWLKDGIDVKSNMDYRQEYVNGVATLVIEESFIEDTAEYTVKATNVGGSASSSANLIVKSRSAMSSAILEEDKPRFVKQMQSVQVNEGETARLDCVVVGKPEPEVTWFKEETAVKESQRVHLTFSGDHCQMVIDQTVPLDTGVYTVRAKNVHGEVANFCQLRVVPKKQAPPQTPPKPRTPIQRPPVIQPALTNTTWQEGETATLQVFSYGEPKPRVHWKFNDSPVQTNSQVQISEQEDGWSRLTIQQISPVNAGMYTVVAENEIGEAVTGATVHVQPSLKRVVTTEHHLQEDMNEHIGQPIQQTVITKKHQEMETRERQDFPQPREPEKIIDEKRWVELVEQHFEEHLSQRSISPVPQIREVRKTESQQRWIDTIDEIWSPVRDVEVTETRTVSGMDQYSSHNVHEPSPRPQGYHTTTTTTNISHIGQSHEPIQPVMGRSTSSNETVKTMNIATIRQSPQREVHEARTTPGPTSEHVATIRKTPVRETHQSSISKAPSLENVAKIRQSPVPETHRSTLTRRSPSVENIAKYQQASQPETYQATMSGGQPVANIAQVHAPTQPDRQAIIKEAPQIDRIDDIQSVPREEKVTTVVKQTEVITSDVDKKYQEQQQKQKQVTSTVTETTSGEGWVQHQHQDFVEPHKSTVTVKKLDIEESQNVNQQRFAAQPEQKNVVTEKIEEDIHRESRIPVKREPQTTTTVTEMTSGEGWVQNTHQDFQNPHLSTTTVKRLDIDEGHHVNYQAQQQQPQQQTIQTRKEEEEESRIKNESKIPIKREPKTMTTVTETTSGEGWVQDVHQDMRRPEQSTITVKRLDIEGGEHVQHDTQQTRNQQVVTTKKEEEENQRIKNESRIPVRREPKTTTTVTETTSGEGWVQNTHMDAAHPHSSTVTVKKLGIDGETTKKTTARPISNEYRRQTDEESSVRQRDSFIQASDVEGFWTDGAYTDSAPTPPPQPIHRSTAEDNMQRIGLSRTTTEPEFIKAFEREYTVEEGGRIAIECILVGNPRPAARFFFNNKQVTEKSEFLKICHVNDTYSIIISPARLEHAGYYKMIAENKRGVTESLTVLHVRPRSLQTYQQKRQEETRLQQQQAARSNAPTEYTTVEEEFAMFEYEQRRPLKHEASKLSTPPPAKRIELEHKKDEEHLETYDLEGKKTNGHPPHFTQTLVSTVVAQGENTTFEGIVTGWPAPTVEWTIDGRPLDLKDIRVSNIGGRVSLNFLNCQLSHAGKYMCTAKNNSGVATSSAQLVVRPKTIAPDFIQRLISEEIEEGSQLKWTVRVTGDPMPKVIWMRDGYEIPDCEEVRIVDHGDGYHSLVIVRVEGADSGQFTCLAENIAGEARSTADLVVRPPGANPGNYFHVTKVTQEKQAKGAEPTTTSAFSIETPRQSEML
ncbi:hypothetical protein GCK72_017200 [Caenorhabditis remanei]|uniref:Ig-like domain-containing protein n=1 Tax=Caenorhabditis remanei TaxID=31234 RepID=A0A6A5G829_CAERE|nr:hypothetical protein GCK72_017200 [Caenorhabditis remanei]KAF1750649.1 hypothetical protein GCK72_017200 [Caenorhabditis remanei]